MQRLKELITSNLTDHPELEEYNGVVLDFITIYQEKRPDMCIEGCKCLIEGVAKFVVVNLDKEYLLRGWGEKSVQQKFKECRIALRLKGYEDEFLERNNGLIAKLGEVRNERGDISHGQAYPKDSYSDVDFAKFIVAWTEGLCGFVLSQYLQARQRQKDLNSLDIYSEEQFKEFDDYLDGLYPEIAYVSYSKALKEQDELQYELMMDQFYKNYE